jgi:TRAP-type uncharacterized transport system substrate-binding protein
MKNRSWKTILIIPIIIAGVTFTASVNGQEESLPDLVFGTAAEGRAYWQLAKRFEKVVVGEGLTVDVQQTQGSLENLERLGDPQDTMNIALTQADTFHNYLADNPGMVNKTKILEQIGLECVFVLTRTNGDLNDEKDWQAAKASRIAVQAIESGPAMTHKNMANLIPELTDDEVVGMDINDAVNALYADNEKKIDLVFVVHRPKYHGPVVRAALEQPDKYRLLSVDDSRLKAQLPTGEEVYEYHDIPLVKDAYGEQKSIRTVCTRGLLISNPTKIATPTRHKLKTIIDLHWGEIYSDEILSM